MNFKFLGLVLAMVAAKSAKRRGAPGTFIVRLHFIPLVMTHE